MFWMLADVEMVSADAMEEFDAGDGNFCSSESLEAEHGADPGFHASMILFEYIAEILR
jgi:hypothetical protein